jgi:hypothetical protein
MDKVHKLSDSERYTTLSGPFDFKDDHVELTLIQNVLYFLSGKVPYGIVLCVLDAGHSYQAPYHL